MENKRMLSEIELANRWGISPKTLQRWRSEQRGPAYIKLSKCVRYHIENVLAYERDKMINSQVSNVVLLDQASVATGCASNNKQQSQHFKNIHLISTSDAASLTKLPAYYFSNKEKRDAFGIPHYYIGRIVRFNLDEIRHWEISMATRAFGISTDRDIAPHQCAQEPTPSQKYTLRDAIHLLAMGKLKLTT